MPRTSEPFDGLYPEDERLPNGHYSDCSLKHLEPLLIASCACHFKRKSGDRYITPKFGPAEHERAMIVAWLRKESKLCLTGRPSTAERYTGAALKVYSDAIERGEHVRENITPEDKT